MTIDDSGRRRASTSGTMTPMLTKTLATDVILDDSKYKKTGIKEKVLGHVTWED